MFPAVCKVVSVPIDLICQNTFRIISCSLKIPFHGYNENITFAIGIKRQLLYPGHSFFVKTQIRFCSKFHWCTRLSTDNRTDVRLADADNPVRNQMYFVLIHVLLLFVDFVNDAKPSRLPGCQSAPCIQKPVNVFSVSADILQLLFDRLSYLLAGTLFTFRQIQVIFSGIPAVHPRGMIIKSHAEVINDPFQTFSCLIQKIYILWKRDILGYVGSIEGQCSVVFTSIYFFRFLIASTAGVVSSGVLNAMIISLISSRMSSVRRLRNSTRSDGTNGASVWYPVRPIKYWKYGFSMISSTSSRLGKPSCFWISREPSAIRRSFAGIPVLLGNSFAYFSSMASHGMVSAFLTQRFFGFIFNPTGWLKSASPS